mmetsp:Transcript_43973/g.113625  ORF Transcript_43973/g.113625 Transcript_43973/m.113625 type:complete len:233 (+) Transcript_43973:646-1344(+)
MPRNSLAMGMGPSQRRSTMCRPSSSYSGASSAYSKSSRTRSDDVSSSTASRPESTQKRCCTSSAKSLARSFRGSSGPPRAWNSVAAFSRIWGESFGDRVDSFTKAWLQPSRASSASTWRSRAPPSKEPASPGSALANATHASRESGSEVVAKDRSPSRCSQFSRPAAKNSLRIRCCASSSRSSAKIGRPPTSCNRMLGSCCCTGFKAAFLSCRAASMVRCGRGGRSEGSGAA